MAKKSVLMFSEIDATMRNLVGGKGANLGQMTKLKMPIPQGFAITTKECISYFKRGRKINNPLKKEIKGAVEKLEKLTKKKFGDAKNPLLVSIRSGARVSMPGMMDTILNLGLNDDVVEGLAVATNNPRFAYDSYRRFIQMYANVAVGVSGNLFEEVIDRKKNEKGIKEDTEFTTDDLKELVEEFKGIYKAETGNDFPVEPFDQLIGAISAVFNSWENPRAQYYRKINKIPGSWGTAVNVQEMVFGNKGETSGTGVAFSRNPATGENKVYGEFLMNAQGEDIVAGIRTPQKLESLKETMPAVHDQFMKIAQDLENHYQDMQDLEFTIEEGTLFILQTRSGKRTAQAALKVAVDMVDEGLINKEEAVLRVTPEQLDMLLHPQFDSDALNDAKQIGKGLPASPGAAAGAAAFSVEEAVQLQERGIPAILVRLETSAEDIEGMHVSEGFLTARGGMTSHAAVVARGMGKTCVAGCHELEINEKAGTFTLGGEKFNRGDYISLDGSTGNIYAGKVETVPTEISGDFGKFMSWVDEFRTLGVRTNADTPEDIKQAINFGAEGVGLTRTEHMFFEPERLLAVREMIVAQNSEQRTIALNKILPKQQADFEELIKALEGRPLTVRYLDPPLHEFLPTNKKEIEELADQLDISTEKLRNIIDSLHEANPMMGHRGCRLSISYPELPKMQTRALMQAYVNVQKKNPDLKLVPEIMIPLVGDVNEFTYLKNIVIETADEVLKENDIKMKYKIGTMMEIPRACLSAKEIAKEADFFSFGTNDLTQMTFGFSRDDAGKFLSDYYSKEILPSDPFSTIDQKGVGELVKTGVKDGRKGNKELKIGICGEHGGDPESVKFFHKTGLDYVSCSPYRVPIARLTAAQVVIEEKREEKLKAQIKKAKASKKKK